MRDVNPLMYVSERTIIKNLEKLELTYIPEQILYRQKQINEIAEIIKNILPPRNGPPSNIMIHGMSGTAKSSLVLKMMDWLHKACRQKNLDNIKVFYVNCSKAKTLITIVRKLCRQAKVTYMYSQGAEELLDSFFKKYDIKGYKMIIILDDIDKLRRDEDKDWIMRCIVRAREAYQIESVESSLKQASVGLICIANDVTFTERLQAGTMESFGKLHTMIFPRYTVKQLQGIIEARVEVTLRKGTITNKIIKIIAQHAKDLDAEARTAIDLLRESALIAEKQKMRKITIEQVEAAKKRIEKQSIYQLLRELTKQESFGYLALWLVNQAMKEGLDFLD